MNRLCPSLSARATALALICAGVLTHAAQATPQTRRSAQTKAAVAASAASAASAVSPAASGKAMPSVAMPTSMPVANVVAPAVPVSSPDGGPASAAALYAPPATSLAATPAPTEPAPTSEATAIADGQATHAWTSAQARGKQASRTQQSLSGPVMGAVEKRYIESFSRPVPERFTTAK